MNYSDIINKNKNELPAERKWWAKFAFHYTDITNALSIIQSETLYSRLYAQRGHLMVNDNASYQVIDMTDSGVQSYVRFYFRPLTPTQYYNEGYKHPKLRYDSDPNANVPVPVFFAFNLEKLLRDPAVRFSQFSQAGYGDETYSGVEDFASLPFDKIYSDGFVEDDVRKYRHAELLYPKEYPIMQSLEAILCRNEFEQSMLLSLLRKNNEKLFYKYKSYIKVCRENMFEKNGLFLQNMRLDNNKFSITFSDTYQKRKYVERMMQKIGIESLAPVKMCFSFEWKNSKQTILESKSVEIDCDYQKPERIVFYVSPIERAMTLSVIVRCFGDLIGYKEFILTDIF